MWIVAVYSPHLIQSIFEAISFEVVDMQVGLQQTPLPAEPIRPNCARLWYLYIVESIQFTSYGSHTQLANISTEYSYNTCGSGQGGGSLVSVSCLLVQSLYLNRHSAAEVAPI